MRLVTVGLVVALACVANAAMKCTGSPKALNGVPCASTTNYAPGGGSACGCPDGWADYNKYYTAAGSEEIFDKSGKSWCGTGCAKCYKITPTCAGCSADGGGAPNTNPIVVMIADQCPPSSDDIYYCPKAGNVNHFGYGAHFDILNVAMFQGLNWDNPEVTYVSVSCNSTLINDYTNTCDCA
eukprot:TRINITY_DN3106_c0_g2_i1.p1 TRINITY_DN3106_c0_g2~~TRINITY_DN3106_c0_g2_i1.p1  ORF type:complete len:182 (+),score=27.27 TRINITY_DN3106_c0_g2_i1:46-591(+)